MSINRTFSALADPTRRKILELLKHSDKPAGELAKSFSITLPSLSHHLNILKNCDLISSRRNGQQIIYSLNLSVFEETAKKFYDLFNLKK